MMPETDAWVQMHREMREDIRALRKDVTELKILLAQQGITRKITMKDAAVPSSVGGTVGAGLMAVIMALYEYLTKN